MIWVVDLMANAWRLVLNLRARLAGSPDFVVVTLSGPYPERSSPARPFWQRFVPAVWTRRDESLEALRARLERIGGAPRVRGVVLQVRDLTAGFATIQSLRDAVVSLKRNGKRVVAYLPSVDLRCYYLATVSDEILMAPAGFWAAGGLRTEITFYRQALDRFGLLPQFERIAEYKTAADPFMRSEMSPAHREVVESVLDALMGEVVQDIAVARRLTPEAVRAAMDRAPVPAGAAAASGLCDGVCYEDELPARLGTMGRPAVLVPWPQVQGRLPVPYRWRAQTAVIGVVELRGAIVTGESREAPVPVPLVGRAFAGADTIGRAFRVAERSRRVRAVVFHVDSRGGSALASDLIWRDVGRLSRSKPVVVFMGDVAGSGGYYVSCGAGRIVAQPATITGSIGVVGGKLTARGLFTQLGLTREIVARGDAATMDSAFAPFSDEQLVRVRQEIETIYRRFIATVSTGRGRPEEEIEGVARGRIWTGRQALERGLVDELGDFSLAVLRARELAGIPPSQSVVTRTIVPPRSALTPVYPPAASGAVAAALDAAGAVQDLLRDSALLIMPEPDLPV